MRNSVPEASKHVNAVSVLDILVKADVFSSRHIYIAIAWISTHKTHNTKRMTSDE
jgi:hypothetical protein